jgi:hypothetical protein
MSELHGSRAHGVSSMNATGFSHPDTDELSDCAGGRCEPVVEWHLRDCRRCQLTVRIFTEARAAFYPDIEVPTYLVDRIIDALFPQYSD